MPPHNSQARRTARLQRRTTGLQRRTPHAQPRLQPVLLCPTAHPRPPTMEVAMAAPAAAATDTAGTADHIGAGLTRTAHDETSGMAAALGTSPSLQAASGTARRMAVARGASTNVQRIDDGVCCAVLCYTRPCYCCYWILWHCCPCVALQCHLAKWRRKSGPSSYQHTSTKLLSICCLCCLSPANLSLRQAWHWRTKP